MANARLADEVIVGIPETLTVEPARLHFLNFWQHRFFVPFSHAFLGSVIADAVDGPNQKEIGNGDALNLARNHLVDYISKANPFGHLKKSHRQTKLLLMDFDGVVDALLIEKFVEDGFGSPEVYLLVDYPAPPAAFCLPLGLRVELDPVGARVVVIALTPALLFNDFACEFGFRGHTFQNIRLMEGLQGLNTLFICPYAVYSRKIRPREASEGGFRKVEYQWSAAEGHIGEITKLRRDRAKTAALCQESRCDPFVHKFKNYINKRKS